MMDKSPLSQQLIELGLGTHESPTYLALLQHSPASAGFLAKKLGFSRSTVYAALDKLSGKGLVGTTYKNNVKQFIAQSPTRISELLATQKNTAEKHIELFSKIADQLQFIAEENSQIPKIMFFEGQDSLKRIYLSMLREAPKNSTMYIMRSEFVWQPNWSFIFSDAWHKQVSYWQKERNIKTELLINNSAEEAKHEKYYKTRKHLQVRSLLKAQSVNDFALYILGDTVSILSLEHNNLIGVKITNKILARNFERIFVAMYNK